MATLVEEILSRRMGRSVEAGEILIAEVDFSTRPFHCKGDGGDTYVADTVVIALRNR